MIAVLKFALDLVHRDGAAGARIHAYPTLGAVVWPVQAGDILEVIAAARALIDADAAGGAEVRINNRHGHGFILSDGQGSSAIRQILTPPTACDKPHTEGAQQGPYPAA
jgi:hypothetical protein